MVRRAPGAALPRRAWFEDDGGEQPFFLRAKVARGEAVLESTLYVGLLWQVMDN